MTNDIDNARERARRRIILARLYIAIGLIVLAVEAYEVRRIHHSLPVVIVAVAFPVLAVLCGALYLWAERRS